MNKNILSDRITRLSESATLEMTRKSRELKAQGKDIITLSIGEPDFDTPENIKQAGIAAINNNITHYPPVPGFLELRQAIAHKLKRDNGLEYKASQIIVSNGAKQSLTNIFMILLNKGDEVIIPSKGFAMTGWRIGYVAAPQFLADALVKLQGQYTSGPGTISQMAALSAMQVEPSQSEEVKNMVATFKGRRDLLIKLMKEIPGIKLTIPNGAFYLFPDVSSYFGKKDGELVIANSNDLCMYLLNKAHVALVPGEAFGSPNCVRLSYATSNELIIEAVKRIKDALAKLK